MAPPAVGDAFPAAGIVLHGASPGDAVDLAARIAGKTVVLVSVPGAFTPTCTKTHIPGIVAGAADLKAAGAEEVLVVCPNDAFVTAAFGDSLGAAAKGVTLLADPWLRLAGALDQVTDSTVEPLGGPRAKRFSVVIDKAGKVAAANWEPDGTGLTCSRAGPDLVAAVKAAAGTA